jgi:hypothetical protein
MHCDWVKDTLDRSAAHLAHLHRIVAHPLHNLEVVTVGAAIFVSRHAAGDYMEGFRGVWKAHAPRAGAAEPVVCAVVPVVARPSAAPRAGCCSPPAAGEP